MTDRPLAPPRALAVLAIFLAAWFAAMPTAMAEAGPGIGLMTFRKGPFPDMGAPIAQGFNDYVAQFNAREGGVGGGPVRVVECEFGYSIARGKDCYDELAQNGTVLVVPGSEGVAKALLAHAVEMRVPLLADGHGSAVLADGRVSAWAFNPPMSHMGEVSAIVQYIAKLEGGLAALRGKRLGVLYLDNEFGTEPLDMLEELARSYGFGLDGWAVPTKYVADQRLQWRQIAFAKPDWLILWGWGPMVTTSLERAAEFGYPVDRVIGSWWTTAEPHLVATQGDATGYRTTTYHAPGAEAPALGAILESVYGGNDDAAEKRGFGTVMYARGVVSAMFATEALRQAAAEAGMTGPAVRDALSRLAVSEERLTAMGLDRAMAPVLIDDCRHAGSGSAAVQQWNGERWALASGWLQPLGDVVRSHVERAGAAYAKANGIALDRSRCGE